MNNAGCGVGCGAGFEQEQEHNPETFECFTLYAVLSEVGVACVGVTPDIQKTARERPLHSIYSSRTK